MEKEVWRKLSIGDLARMNAEKSHQLKDVNLSQGDMVTVLNPYSDGVDYCGLVIKVSDTFMILYHGKFKEQMRWPINVKYKVDKL